MNIRQLPSGSYQIRQMYEGKNYTITLSYKPTKKEATMLMSEKIAGAEKNLPDSGTLRYYIDKYISFCKKAGKSPATIRTYVSLLKNIPDDLLDTDISKIDNTNLQKAIDLYAANHAPKGTRNMFTLVSATMAKYRPEFRIIVKLPTGEKKAEYEPTTEDIKKIIEYMKKTKYSVAIQLAVLGLRRGEIYALELSDLSDNNVLTISKDTVLDENNNLITKQPKTQASVRRILLPDDLANEIRSQGYIYHGAIGQINKYLASVQSKLGITHFKLHKLRAYCVAYLHKMGFTDEQIMAWGGWATSSIMATAYRYNLDPEESQSKMANAMANILN